MAGTSNDREFASILPKTLRFLHNFNTAIYERNYDLMKRLYEVEFPAISAHDYADLRWPEDSRVLQYYQEEKIDNEVVLSLYRELYFQHVFARTPRDITWNDRFLASCNYVRLLEYFANVECDPKNDSPLAFPESWLWDMVNNFVYQYQETQLWKFCYAKQIASNQQAMESLHSGRGAWRGCDVCRILNVLIEKSTVKEWLAEQKLAYYQSTPNNQQTSVKAQPPIFMGYFSIIALVSLQVSLGNYRTALEIAAPIELSPKGLYWTVPACHVTLFYNLGFAYMMMRRYQDAIRVLSQILLLVGKNPNYLEADNFQQQIMIKLVEKMYYLIMLCQALSPARLDESIKHTIEERWGDIYLKLQSDKDVPFRDTFIKACPKFCSPMISDYDDPEEHMNLDENESLNRQINMFLKDVTFQKQVLNVRSIARLYNNLTLSKLANLMGRRDAGAVDTVQSEILCVKNRAEQLIWDSGPFLNGKRVQTLTDLDIYLDLNTIHVKNLTIQQNYVEDFVMQINKIQDYMKAMEAKSFVPPAATSYENFV